MTIQRASEGASIGLNCFRRRVLHEIFSATRSFALRERGLTRCSVSPGSTGLRRDELEGEVGIGLRLRPLGTIEQLAAAIAKEIFHDAIFQGMEGNDGKSRTGYESPGQGQQSFFESAEFVVHFHAQRLEDLRRRMPASVAPDDLLDRAREL